MTTYDRGDVVYIPFQFTQGERFKTRPGVVISSKTYHESRLDIIVAGVTSNLDREDFVGHLPIDDWADCGLVRPSAISGIIQTIRASQIRERVGSLSPRDQTRLDATLRQVLGL